MRPSLDATAAGVLLVYLWPAAVIAYDVWLMLSDRETISSRILKLCETQPILGVLLGGLVFFLLSHLFFTQTPRGELRKPDGPPRP